jgi:polysaccharide biosynthesis protein PslJ
MVISIVPTRLRPASKRAARGDLRLLTLLLVLLIAIPSILIFGPLGSAGTPADVLGLAMLAVWVLRLVAGNHASRSANPVQVAMLAFAGAALASYVAAATRPITALELTAADRGLLRVAAWLGMFLFTLAAPRTLDQLHVLMRRLVAGGAALATLGLAQFVTKMRFVNYIQIPGLQDNTDLSPLADRNNLTRPPGTAIHPIEFGAVLTMILPFALHYALADSNRSLFRRWYPVFAIAVAVPISISRSAIISALVGLLFVVPTWPTAIRRRAYAAIVLLTVAMYLVVHGLLGTLMSLFTGVGNDSSALSRTDSYGLAFEFIARSPLFGRGMGTFLPAYRILDNQLLGTMIDMGIVGFLALVTLSVTSISSSIRVRSRTTSIRTRGVAQACAASVAAATTSFAFYDAFSFPMEACLFFLVIGCSGALVRLSRQEPSHA